MNRHTEVSIARPSLLLLNWYCLLDIFEFLNLEDFINLTASCKRFKSIAERILKKRSHFQLDSRMLNKGTEFIEYCFSYIGQHVSSLILDCSVVSRNVSLVEIICIIIKYCENLRCLRIDSCIERRIDNLPPYSFANNVELLTLKRCIWSSQANFLKNFEKLKSFNVIDGYINNRQLNVVLENNPNIESFVCVRKLLSSFGTYSRLDYFSYILFELIPNVKKLSLDFVDLESVSSLKSLLEMNQLVSLELSCRSANLNTFLIKLARKGILVELCLRDVVTNGHFFDVLSLFDKLLLLDIQSSNRNYKKLRTSIAWPTKLKRLRLRNFQLTNNDLIAIIQQLESVEIIDLQLCQIADSTETSFNDATLSQQILHVINKINRKQRLDVILNDWAKLPEEYVSKKLIIESEHLRIFQSPYELELNPLGIRINFPDYGSTQETAVRDFF